MIKGFRFYFKYGEQSDKPAHIHVVTKRGEIQFWLNPFKLKEVKGVVSIHDQNQTARLVAENLDLFLSEWNKAQSK